MSEDWRTDEPGNFQLAWIKKEIGKVVGFYRRWKSQPGGWWSNGMMMIGEFSDFPEWLPISTFEEERLRAEVGRLRDLIIHQWIHAAYPNGGYKYLTSEEKELYDSVIKNRQLERETEAGGAGE